MVALAAKTSYIVFTPCPPDEHVVGEALAGFIFEILQLFVCHFYTKMLSSFYRLLWKELLLPSTKEQFCFLTALRISQKALISPHL